MALVWCVDGSTLLRGQYTPCCSLFSITNHFLLGIGIMAIVRGAHNPSKQSSILRYTHSSFADLSRPTASYSFVLAQQA